MRYIAAVLCAALPLAWAGADESAKARARAAVAVTLTMPQPEAAKPAPAPADPNPWRWDPVRGLWWRPVPTSHQPVTPRVQVPAAGWHAAAPAVYCPPGRGG